MPDDLNARLGLDSSDFKTQLISLNRELRVMESGFRASSASLGDWGKSASGLEMRIKSLNSQMEVQAEKVSRIQGEYDRVAKEQGQYSRGAQELLIKLNKETETLGKMENELNQAKTALDKMGDESVQTGKQLDDLGEKEDKLAKKTLSLNDVMRGLGTGLKVGVKAIAAVGAAAIAAAGALGALIGKSIDAAGELVDMSLETGLSVEKLQELQYIGGQVGTDVDTIAKSLARMTRSMSDVGSSKEITAAFDKLGVSARDSNGELRDSEVVFGELIDSLGKVENETERDALAMEIFGRSAMELNPLIKAGADEIARMTDEAHEMGAVMDTEAVEGLEAIGDEFDGLKNAAKGVGGTLAAAFLPGLKGITGAAKGYMKELAKIVSGSDGDLAKMASGIGQLLGTIISDIAKKAPDIMDAGLGILQGLINAIVQNLPVLIQAVIAIINAIVQFIIQNLPLLITAAIQIIMALVNGLLIQLPMLLKAAVQLMVTLALGIAKAIPELMPTIAKIIPEIIIALIESLPLLIDAALELILALVDGLIIALPILIEYIPEIVTAIFNAIIQALPKIGEAAVKLVIKLVDGIGNMLPRIGKSGGDLVKALVNGVKQLVSQLFNVGGAMVTAIWDGLKQKEAWFRDQIKKFFQGIMDGIKNVIDWHSPPGKYVEIGAGMAQALGIGFTSAFGRVDREITNAIKALSAPETNLALAGAGSGYGGRAQPQALAPVTVNANVANEIDIHRLARLVAAEQQRQRR